MTVPLFDSLTHPLLSGTWFGKEASFESLSSELDAAHVARACAVGAFSIGGYEHEAFAKMCALDPRLVPIAAVHTAELSSRPKLISDLKAMGYQGVKIHPRFLKISLRDPKLALVLAELEKEELPLFLCTYAHTPLDHYPHEDPLYATVALLQKFPALKTVLLHGGDVSLLRYAEVVRHNPNLLLDLSFTLCKYEGSSIDLDLAFLFRSLDERICVGSDYPDFSPRKTRERFEHFSRGLAPAKIANIAHGNLARHLAVEL